MEYNLQIFIVLIISFSIWAYKNLKIQLSIVSFIILALSLLSANFQQLFNGYFAKESQQSVFLTLSLLSYQAISIGLISLIIPRCKSIFSFFAHIAILDCLYCIIRHFAIPSEPPGYAMGLCPTMDGVFIAILYPYTIKFALDLVENRVQSVSNTSIYQYVLFTIYTLLPIGTVIMLKGSAGLGGICLTLLLLNVHNSLLNLKFKLYNLFALSIPFAIFYAASLYFPIFRDHHRLFYWKLFMDFWWRYANHWIGFGAGSFSSLGLFIQVNSGNTYEIFPLMHNDWLQCLFEYGYIGFVSILSLTLYCMYKSRTNKYLLTSIIVYSACAIFYYPAHNLIIGVFGVLLVKESLEIKSS